jgi:hypothetical protein
MESGKKVEEEKISMCPCMMQKMYMEICMMYGDFSGHGENESQAPKSDDPWHGYGYGYYGGPGYSYGYYSKPGYGYYGIPGYGYGIYVGHR